MSKIHKFIGENGNFEWDRIKTETYPNDPAKKVTRQEIVGSKDGVVNFTMRYFEVAPGSKSSLDSHEHDHGVMIIRGHGEVILNEKKYEIGYGDVIYISPFEQHQFVNNFNEPLGFICVIPPKKKLT